MEVITYLGLTVISIFIQICLMDFIPDKVEEIEDSKVSVKDENNNINDLLKNITNNPHALYYRTNRALKKPVGGQELAKITNSTPLVPLTTSTEVATTTVLEVLYDENVSDTEPSTTETLDTTTDFDNITEIPFFDTKNKSIEERNVPSKTSFSKFCSCNLLYKECDINCCCDSDCNNTEINVFECDDVTKTRAELNPGCISYLVNEYRHESTMLDNLFCVVKTNLPTKRTITKYNAAVFDRSYKWKQFDESLLPYEFNKTSYKQSDPIWLLKNGTLYYLDYPHAAINNYCTDRKPITFLKQETVKCNIKLNELEMFNVNNLTKEAVVISATEKTLNATTVNCSNAYCTNLSVLVCNNDQCVPYNTSLNQATCTNTICTNMALRIDYDFYYYNSKIFNASVKLHIYNVTAMIVVTQEINVKFHMTNMSTNPIQFSGNPGYIKKLPVIVSYVTSNFTNDFFNNTNNNRLLYPDNRNGECMLSNTSKNVVTFDTNKLTKCRYRHPTNIGLSKTNLCKTIQDNVNRLLGLNQNISVSPFGNPYNISDESWVQLKTENKESVYGTYNENKSKLRCYNLVTHISLIFAYAKVDELLYKDQNKILFAKYVTTPKNLSFSIDDVSTVVSTDVLFVDMTKPSLIEYATSPQLNIKLPKDFFFPFPSNSCSLLSYKYVVVISCVVNLLNKITL